MNWTPEKYGGVVLLLITLFDFVTTWAGGANLFAYAFAGEAGSKMIPAAILSGGIMAAGVFVALIILPRMHLHPEEHTFNGLGSAFLIFALVADLSTSYAGIFAFFGQDAFARTMSALSGEPQALISLVLASSLSFVMIWATIYFPRLLRRLDLV